MSKCKRCGDFEATHCTGCLVECMEEVVVEAMEDSNVRPEVTKFAEIMEKQLKANEHKGGWKRCDSSFLMKELQRNYDALWALQPDEDKAQILRRAANIANFAMMIADNWGGLGEGENDEGRKERPGNG